MKVRMNKYICKGVLTIMAAVPLASCNDFLTIMPLNEVVLENYWTEEADVNSCVYGCYAQLISTDCLERMLVWGELRSDNLTANANAEQDLTRITEENLLETNAYTNWLSFYQCINRCNTVIHYAPMVQEKDPITPPDFGHGMLFKTFGGKWLMAVHSHYNDHGKYIRVPHLFEVDLTGDKLVVGKEYKP